MVFHVTILYSHVSDLWSLEKILRNPVSGEINFVALTVVVSLPGPARTNKIGKLNTFEPCDL